MRQRRRGRGPARRAAPEPCRAVPAAPRAVPEPRRAEPGEGRRSRGNGGSAAASGSVGGAVASIARRSRKAPYRSIDRSSLRGGPVSSGMAGLINFEDEEEVKSYLENLHVEYSYECFKEKDPDGKRPHRHPPLPAAAGPAGASTPLTSALQAASASPTTWTPWGRTSWRRRGCCRTTARGTGTARAATSWAPTRPSAKVSGGGRSGRSLYGPHTLSCLLLPPGRRPRPGTVVGVWRVLPQQHRGRRPGAAPPAAGAPLCRGSGAGGGEHSSRFCKGAEHRHVLPTLRVELPVLPLLWPHNKSCGRVGNLKLLPSEESTSG